MDIRERSLQKHYEWGGKLEMVVRAPIEDRDDLALAYTPGVAQPCLEIQKDEAKAYELTAKHETVAVITDGSAVLGLGDIGPSASMPVMEGKCALFKRFGGLSAVPICVATQDVDELVRTIFLISKSFGGINLEDIAAPRCFEVEERLKALCDVPVFHDDQHGTAIVVAAALINALRVTGRDPKDTRIVINGAGAAGIAIAKLLLQMQLGQITLCDRLGAVCEGEPWMTEPQKEMAKFTNKEKISGTLCDIIKDKDVFIGVSKPALLTGEMVRSMRPDPIVFAMANPTPEIMPDEALAAGARVVGTGRSDFPNQINNVLVFPGIFKGALAAHARDITDEMKAAAARAIASLVSAEDLAPEHIIPDVFDARVADVVADAVAKEATKERSETK